MSQRETTIKQATQAKQKLKWKPTLPVLFGEALREANVEFDLHVPLLRREVVPGHALASDDLHRFRERDLVPAVHHQHTAVKLLDLAAEAQQGVLEAVRRAVGVWLCVNECVIAGWMNRLLDGWMNAKGVTNTTRSPQRSNATKPT